MMASLSGENTPGEVSLIKEIFRKILQQHLQLDSELLAELIARKLLTGEESKEIALKQANISNAAGVRLLFEKLPPSSDIKFLKCLEDSNDTSNKLLASYILDEQPIPALSDQHQKFCRVFEAKLPELVSKLKPSDMLDKLYLHLSQEVTEGIEAIEDRSSKSKAALHLCLSLLRCASDWPSAFVDVLEKDNYDVSIFGELKNILPMRDAQQLPTSVDTSFGKESDSFTSTQSFQDAHHEEMPPGDMHAASLHEREELVPATSREVFKGRETAANPSKLIGATGSGTSESDTANDFSSDFHQSLWSFQRKIAEPALKKLNTLLVSPTGTGKTHVAAYIIDQHLNELEAKKMRGRVVFIVPTVRLAKQQQNKLEELIGSRTRIIMSVIGDDIDVDCSLLSIMTAENVCVTVMTAQVFVNGMKKTSPAETVHMEDVTLLILDECHHTTKEHPYNSIMRIYLQKRMCTNKGDIPLPQVVGMTANPGTGGSSSDDKAEKHIFQVAASLDASVIQPVPVDEDLMKYLNIPEDIGPIILKPRQKDPFRNVLENVMKKIEEKIATLFAGSTFDGKTVTPKSQRDTQNYETWIAEFKKKCRESRNKMSKEQHQTVIICLENLKIYNKALCIHRDVRPKDAVRYLEREISELKLRTGQCYEELVKLFEDSSGELEASISDTEENPLLKKIKEMFVVAYKENPDSRTILFTRTRPYTKALQEWIQEDEELQKLNMNPGRIIGSQGPEISKSEGDETIHKFRLGEHKLVVSTNVLEEGFDLKECNLVIRHNYVPSETGHTQVKGRGRAKGSKSFLVALTDTGRDFRDQEMNNKIREQWSERLLQKISNMSPRKVEQRIKEQQTQLWRDMFLRQQTQKPLGNADAQKFRLICSKCPQVVCSGADIVCFMDSKYIVTDSKIRDICKIERKSRPLMIKSNEFMNGKIYCKGCGHPWGSWCTIKGDNYPMLTIKQLDIENIETKKVEHFNQWSKVYKLFPIRKVDTIKLNFDIADATDVE